MFTGIIEQQGRVVDIINEGTNKHFVIEAEMAPELKVDQSVAHNGVCLTVVECSSKEYKVTAIDETLQKTNLGKLKIGDSVNLERCMPANGRFDGHMVYGHVDTVGTCTSREFVDGSTVFSFNYKQVSPDCLVVEKGSIGINGISLTVFNVKDLSFSVAIIPYTLENTNLKEVQKGDDINLEFDILGKYITRALQQNQK